MTEELVGAVDEMRHVKAFAHVAGLVIRVKGCASRGFSFAAL
jgi:hypothetical protein